MQFNTIFGVGCRTSRQSIFLGCAVNVARVSVVLICDKWEVNEVRGDEQCEIFKNFTWKITCNGIHNIFISDNFSLTSKGATLA